MPQQVTVGFHPDLKRKIEYIKKVSKIPVVAGFGIKILNMLKDMASVADGIVVVVRV